MKRRYKVSIIALLVLVVAFVCLDLVLSHDSACGAATAVPANTPAMKAVVHRCYGSPDVVRVEDIAKPTLEDNRMLVKVQAASVNPVDWHLLRGDPYIMRLDSGVGAPKDIRIGSDFAGTVEAVGKSVTRFKPGDEVFGDRDGALAEYVNVRENGGVALKPANVSFEEAAAAPVAAVTALQALRDEGRIQAGQRVLINGASGGVGTFAVQIAKSYGANVTGVSSSRNVAMVRSLGADQVIDYTHEDFTQGAQRYDLIVDLVGNRSLSDVRRVLTPNGVYVGIGGGGPENGGLIGPMGGTLEQVVVSWFVSQKLTFFVADVTTEDLNFLGGLMRSGKLKSVIDKRFPLQDAAAALRYLEQGHARGKVIVTVDSP